jgi:glycosyltransferase involved in cell wall biosynthesis
MYRKLLDAAFYGRVLRAMAPEGTFRRKLLRLPKRLARSLQRRGVRGTYYTIRNKLRKRGLQTDLGRWLAWIEENEPTSRELRAQRAWSAGAGVRPIITLIMPVRDANLLKLRATIRSVMKQTYRHWQLCLVVGPDDAATVCNLVRRCGGNDTRLNVLTAPPGMEAEAYRSHALANAGGDYVGLLHAGDVLSPHALCEIGHLLASDPSCDVVYTDEDCRSSKTGDRFGLALKPDWSPELMLSYNYLGRLTVVRRTLAQEVGGYRAMFESAQDWDLLLRISERTDRIHRVPRCVYHRASGTATLPELTVSPETAALQRQALTEHLQRREVNAWVETMTNGTHRATWPVAGCPLVSIIIPSLNNLPLIRRCIEGLTQKTEYSNTEIIIVDNKSTDPAVHQFYEDCTRKGQ